MTQDNNSSNVEAVVSEAIASEPDASEAKPTKAKSAAPKRSQSKTTKSTRSTATKSASAEKKSTGKAKSEDGAAKPAAKTGAKAAAAGDAAAGAKKPAAKSGSSESFKAGEAIVYPAHGVGHILEIEEQVVAGHKLELYVINFEKDKMTLRVPTNKAKSVGMRKLSNAELVTSALETLSGRARVKRTMWSRRAQEYEAKINSGDLISIAEVVRDLYRSDKQPEQSYSERQLYEAALDRMAREVAAVENVDEATATERLEEVLAQASAKNAKSASSEEAA